MRVVVQRVLNANCVVESNITGQIEKGYMLLVGIKDGDTHQDIEKMALKVSKLRIFDDPEGNMNLDIHAVNGDILSISQFTLYGDAKKGNRPSFIEAKKGDEAKEDYLYFNECLRKEGLKVEEGIFGADMKISLTNDGPVTILLEV